MASSKIGKTTRVRSVAPWEHRGRYDREWTLTSLDTMGRARSREKLDGVYVCVCVCWESTSSVELTQRCSKARVEERVD